MLAMGKLLCLKKSRNSRSKTSISLWSSAFLKTDVNFCLVVGLIVLIMLIKRERLIKIVNKLVYLVWINEYT